MSSKLTETDLADLAMELLQEKKASLRVEKEAYIKDYDKRYAAIVADIETILVYKARPSTW